MDRDHPTTDRSTGLVATFLTSGVALVLLGLAIIVAWHAHVESLLQLDPNYPPMQYNTAVCFVLLGSALLLRVAGYRGVTRILIAAVAGVSLLNLIEDIFSVELGIDQLLFQPYIVTATAAPGRMAPHTAVAFILSCLAIGLTTARQPRRQHSAVLAVIGSLVASIGAVALVGYMTGFEQAYGWERFTKMAAQTAAGFVALGVGILALGWREARALSAHTPRWLFAPIIIGVMACSIIFFQALINYEDQQIDFRTQTEAAAVQQEVESELEASIAVVSRIAARWGSNGPPDRSRWVADTSLNFDGPTLYQSIAWVDPEYRLGWVVPTSTNARYVGSDLRDTPELKQTLATARMQQRAVISPPFDRGRNGLEIVVAHPAYVNNRFDGFIVGIFYVEDLFGQVLNDGVASTSSIAVYDGQRRIFIRDTAGSDQGEQWEVETPANILNMELTLRVWPSSVSSQRSILPYGTLVVGIILAGLLGLVTWLLQHAAERSQSAQLANESLQVEVAQRRRTEAELIQSTDALQRSNRSLQEFAYVASHDLKAPLVSLQGLATMLHDDIGDTLDGDARLYLDRIVFNATRMRNLLDDLLELSRVGSQDAHVSAVDLGAVIDGVTEQLHQSLRERSATVIVTPPLPTVAGNPIGLHRVFANLIDNALKYTPLDRQPHIEISAIDAGTTWEVTVRDNGTGIPAEHRDKIFTMFQRLPKGRAMNPSGTGMGLAIISRIVESNGGRCWIAESNAGGTAFCLTLPKPKTQDEQQVARTPHTAGVASVIHRRRDDEPRGTNRTSHLPDR